MANRTVQMLASAFVAVSCFQAHAWSSGGHMVIAAEAYHELSPALRSKVTELLKAHPEYEKWVGSFRPDRPDLDLGTFVFMKASTWPDEIRRRHNHYDHPRWHYVDYRSSRLPSRWSQALRQMTMFSTESPNARRRFRITANRQNYVPSICRI